MAGWGDFLGKLADYFQGRSERRRNKINAIKNEMRELERKPCTAANIIRMRRLSEQLYTLETQATND